MNSLLNCRPLLIVIVFVAGLGSPVIRESDAAATRPNILFLFADDQSPLCLGSVRSLQLLFEVSATQM